MSAVEYMGGALAVVVLLIALQQHRSRSRRRNALRAAAVQAARLRHPSMSGARCSACGAQVRDIRQHRLKAHGAAL